MLDLLIRFSPYRSLTEKGNWVFYGKCCFATWFFWVLWFSHMIFLGVVIFSHDFSGCCGFLTWFFCVLWFSHMVFSGYYGFHTWFSVGILFFLTWISLHTMSFPHMVYEDNFLTWFYGYFVFSQRFPMVFMCKHLYELTRMICDNCIGHV